MRNSKLLLRSRMFRLNFSLKDFSGLFIRNDGAALFNILKGMFIVAGAKITNGRIRLIYRFITLVKHLLETQGPKGTTKFLKAAGVSIQQSLGGHVVVNMMDLGARSARTRKGLPKFIPAQLRILIRQGDPTTTRIILTLVNVFRVFTFPGSLKIGTIIRESTGTGALSDWISRQIPRFVELFVRRRFSDARRWELLKEYSNIAPGNWLTSGPGVIAASGLFNSHPTVLLRSLATLRSMPSLWDSVLILSAAMPRLKLIRTRTMALETILWLNSTFKGFVKTIPYIGKIGLKEEAAGKVRAFAMVDAWTQWLLEPLHRLYFEILKGVPMDGTFDQIRPAKALLARAKSLYSLDLSAATDRIPVGLQQFLLGHILNFEIAQAWRNLLVGRVYRLHTNNSYKDLQYAVGQPMGALSSWASLAMVHHCIVQLAAWRAGHSKLKLYTRYAILGDDIMIADKAVMIAYLEILDSLGVECGLSKSILSPTGTAAEFAKRTFYKGVDVSPVPLREFHAASKHLGAMIELKRKYNLSLSSVLHAFGVGWQVRSWLNKPLGKLSARVRLLILSLNLPQTPEEVSSFFALGANKKKPLFWAETRELIPEIVKQEAALLRVKITKMLPSANARPNVIRGKATQEWASQMLAEAGKTNIQFSTEREVSMLEMRPPQQRRGGLSRFEFIEDALWHTLNSLLALTWDTSFSRRQRALVDALIALTKIENSKEEFNVTYIDFLKVREAVSREAIAPFHLTRPNPPEIKGIIPPGQVQFWKRWSGLIQGTSLTSRHGISPKSD